MKQIWLLLLSAILATIGIAGWLSREEAPPVESVASSALLSLREQNRLVPFSARFVTVVTSRKEQMGLSAQKTLIVPAQMDYEVDLSGLTEKDLDWNADTGTLTIRLPDVQPRRASLEFERAQEYGSGAILMAVTDAERVLDDANRKLALKDVADQARAPAMLNLARGAARRAIASSFALPLRAAGIEKVTVRVEFAA